MIKIAKNIALLLFTYVLFQDPSNGMDNDFSEENPPFYELTFEGKVIYILGSSHYVGLEKLLNKNIIKKIQELSQSGTVLYLEHEISNKGFLQQISKESTVRKGKDFLSLIKDEEITREFDKFKNHKIKLNFNEESNEEFDILIKAPFWLVAPILSTHAGIMSFSKFGGMEYELKSLPWLNVEYLENDEEMIKILKKNGVFSLEDEDTQNNISWIKNSIRTISLLLDNNHAAQKLLIEEIEQRAKSFNSFNWNIINDSQEIQVNSVKERNKLWADKILNDLKKEDRKQILIVVGKDHLQGVKNGFVSLLKQRANLNLMKRLTTNGEWIIFN